MAALAYPLWFVVFPLVYIAPDKRENPFLRFHAYQGAALGVFGIVGLSLVRAVLGFLFRWMILFDVLLYPILKMGEWAVLATVLYGTVMAWRGHFTRIPYLSDAVHGLFENSKLPSTDD